MKHLLRIDMVHEPILEYGLHSHTLWEIVYYTYGSGIVTVNGADIPFMPGFILCVPPNTPHREISENGFMNTHFSVQFFDDGDAEPRQFMDSENKDFFNIMVQMHREYHLKRNNWFEVSESMLGVLSQYLLAWRQPNRHSPQVEKLISILISNLATTGFSIEKALANAVCSPDHLRNRFKKDVGVTPVEYLLNKRIQYAKELLETRNTNGYRINQIAHLCGFEDPYYFSRVYKRLTGRPPNQVPIKTRHHHDDSVV